MSFIEELMKSQGTDALGITYEEPKADENINKLISDNELSPEIQEVIQSAIFGGVGGPEGSLRGLTKLIKSKGGIETLKKLMPDSKNVVKFIESMNKKSLKNLSKPPKRFYSEYDDKVINKFIKENTITLTNEGRNALNKVLERGFRGQKAIDKAFVKRPSGEYYIRENINESGTIIKAGMASKPKSIKVSDAYRVPPTGGGGGGETPTNILSLLSLLATGGLAGYTANKATKEYNLDNILSKMLRPDPSMPTKQQNDEDMNLMKMLMSPETQLKYLKNTGQGYPADEEMFLRSETENTNEMLLKLLGQ